VIALLLRRARVQWPLLLSLLAVLTIGATLLGTCALLVTRTADRAVEVAASRAEADDVEVTAYTATISSANARSVAADTRTVLTSSLRPFAATTSTRASSEMRRLPAQSDDKKGVLSEGYLSGVDGLQSQATLIAGRWPRSAADGARPGTPLEAVLFENTARLLGLKVGSQEHLGTELGRFDAPELDVKIVGLVHPLPDTGWDRDVLGGAGYDPSPEDAAYAQDVTAYGPFLVTLDDLMASRSDLARLEVTAHPDLSSPAGRDLERLPTAVLGADSRLAGTLGDRVRLERVASPLPRTLLATRDQQKLTAGEVLALALIGVLLTAIALALAGRLTTGVRAEESALFTALGTSRSQFAAVSSVEAAVLAVLAAVLAVPASSVLHALLSHVQPLKGAGLTTPPALTLAQVLAVGGGALALAVLHVGLAVRPASDSGDRRTRRELLARSGADLLLFALAGVGWWQLRSQPAAAGSRADAVRVLAPALLLTAGTALALRLLPPALRRAERLAGRSRGTVFPLAAFQAARRPQAYAAGLLIGLACAAATFGTAFDATWDRSQHDQADVAVGTDLALTLDAPPAAGQGARVAAATGGTVSQAVGQNVAVGQWLGGEGQAPWLVAVDTTKAAALLRGRVGTDWARVTAPLAPAAPVSGPALPEGAVVKITGKAQRGDITVTPRLLLQDAAGLRTACSGPVVPLDGRPHAVRGCAPVAGLRLVGVAMPVDAAAWDQPQTGIDVTLELPGGSGSPTPWSARAASPEAAQVQDATADVTGNRVRLRASVKFAEAAEAARVLVASTFDDPGPVPVIVSSAFAQDVSAKPGSQLSLTFTTVPVTAVVDRIVPTIPSAPGAPAALADVDTLSRALAVHGQFDSPITGWWAGHPRPDATARTAALHLGKVTSRATETARLTGSPARASLPAVLRVLVAAAALLLVGGVILHVACDVQLRALEVARLRGLGMSRGAIRASLLGEHAAVLLPLVLAGAVIGGLATWVVAPLLIRSDTGAAPVPPAIAEWPWAAETALIGLLVVAAALAVLAVVTVQARRADAAHLRVAS
jgi:hypothetical protein